MTQQTRKALAIGAVVVAFGVLAFAVANFSGLFRPDARVDATNQAFDAMTIEQLFGALAGQKRIADDVMDLAESEEDREAILSEVRKYERLIRDRGYDPDRPLSEQSPPDEAPDGSR